MAGAKFQYDESGGTFFYFLLSFLALVVIPCTYYFWPKDEKEQQKERDRNICNCDPCNVKLEYLKANEPWKNVKRNLIKFAIILGWIAMIATAYKCDHLQNDTIAFDPLEILGIPAGSTPAQIKKAYRQLSLIYHPDKETGDQERFVKITKAYAALTDDTARENWEKYGNPDGPGATSFGIALPSWIVEKENSIFVLGLYALVFMIALPTIVGIWWYRSIKFNGDQVLWDTTNIYYYFIHKTDNLMLKRVIAIIAASLEFERGHNSEIIERPTDQYEVPNLIKEISNLGESNKERPLCYPYSIKARALIFAHLSRLKLPPTTLELDKLYIVKKIPTLLQEFVQCVGQLTMLSLIGRVPRTPSLETLENAMKLCSMVVQGTWEYRNQLLQLPHITNANLKYFSNKKRTIRTIQQLALLREEERRSMLSHFNDNQYEDIINVIKRMPLLKVAAKPEVIDDEDSGIITAGAMVTVTVTLERKSMQVLIEKSRSSSNATNQDDLVNDENEKLLLNHKNGDENEQQTKNKPPAWKKVNKKTKGKGKKKGGGPNKKPFQKQQNNNQQVVQQNAKKANESDNEDDQSDSASIVGSNDNSENENGSTTSATDNRTALTSPSENTNKKALKDKKSSNTEKSNESDEEEWDKFQEKVAKKEKILESKSKMSHSVHCPFFSDDKQEYWWIYMVDRKRPALATYPVLMTSLVEFEEIELKFTAPSRPGTYKYEVIIKSDSYVDFTSVVNLKFEVEKAKAYEPPAQWDLSEDDEEEVEDDAVEDSDLDSDLDSEGAVTESESSDEEDIEEVD